MSVLIVLILIWIGVYCCSMIFDINLYIHPANWVGNRAFRVLDQISLLLQNSYNMFLHAGPTGGIEYLYMRLLCVSLAGMALSACGAVFQGAFRNVLAGPSTMGVMSGGSLGCMIYLIFFYTTGSTAITQAGILGQTMNLLQTYIQQLSVLAGCFGGVILVLFISTIVGKGKVSASAMIISGMVFSGIISNITMVCQYLIVAKDPYDTRVEAMRDLMMGNLDRLDTLSVLLMMGIPTLFCLIVLLSVRGTLNLFSFGEEEAIAMGINVHLYRNLMIITGTVLTAIVVSFCGQIGFVGFMVPMIIRRFSGPDLRRLLPYSILTGAIFLTVVYDITHIFALSGINIITGPLGSVVMIIALFRKGGAQNATEEKHVAQRMGLQ